MTTLSPNQTSHAPLAVSSRGVAIQGSADRSFQPVVEAFARVFDDDIEAGGAFALYRDGELVVDLWAGQADQSSKSEWTRETVCGIFSGTKGIVAACLLILIERGVLDLETPVAHYWPEFGKPEILVRHVVSHTSRLPGITSTVSFADVVDSEAMAARIAAEAPSADPRSVLCYHPFTFGWICAELIRRIDGRAISTFLKEEIAERLQLDIWLGLPASEAARVATLELAPDWDQAAFLSPEVHKHDPFLRSIFGNPELLSRPTFPWNRSGMQSAGNPGAGAIASARSVAGFYGRLPELLSEDTIRLGTTPLSSGWFGPVGEQRAFGVGWQLAQPGDEYTPLSGAFGHTGAGGSVHGAWPDERIGFSYLPNLLRMEEPSVSRARRILTAVFESIQRKK